MKGPAGDHHHEPRSRQPPLRSPSRPAFGQDDRGRLLRRASPPSPRSATRASPSPATTCISAATCGSDLVYPVEWDEAGATHWEVTLRCPNCEWAGTGVFEQTIVERFDEVLDRGTEALVRDLKRMMHANMEDEIERFVTALDADHILPDDF